MTDDTDAWFSEATATFGDRLTAAREAAGLDIEDFARRLGVRDTTVRAWEDDRTDPRANRLQMMAGMLGVSIRWLLTGEGDGLAAPPAEARLPDAAREVLADMGRLRATIEGAAADLARAERRLRAILREAA